MNLKNPTLCLRWISREVIRRDPFGRISTERQSFLQQFYEHENGPDSIGDMFKTTTGSWCDVPTVLED